MPEITDTDVLELFAGKQDAERTIQLSDFESIKNAVIPRTSSIADYLLLLLWIREVKFGMSPWLKWDDMVILALNAFAINDIEVGDEIEWKAFVELVREGCLQETTADRQTKIYSLTLKGKKTAEKMFGAKGDTLAHVEAPPFILGSDVTDYPFMIQAANGRGVPKSAVEACQESIEWAEEPANVNIENPKGISDPIVKAIDKQTKEIQKQTAILENLKNEPKSVYLTDKPITTKSLQKPNEKDGFWEPQTDYATRVSLEVKSLQKYRETKEGMVWAEDGTWGIDGQKHICRKVGRSYDYFFFYTSELRNQYFR
jgi:hypothetical protein